MKDSEMIKMEESDILIPSVLLKQFGCNDCIFKNIGGCPHNLDTDANLPAGYCDEISEFLVSLSSPGDSISAIKEKFYIYTQELQMSADYKEYWKLVKHRKELVKIDPNHPNLRELDMKIASYKIWWMRLQDSVVKSLSKVVDREKKTNDNTLQIEHKISLQEIHKLANDAKEKKSNNFLNYSKVIDVVGDKSE